MSVKLQVEQMREQYPYFTDLITAYIIAKREGDEPTAYQVKLLMDQYQKEKKQ